MFFIRTWLNPWIQKYVIEIILVSITNKLDLVAGIESWARPFVWLSWRAVQIGISNIEKTWRWSREFGFIPTFSPLEHNTGVLYKSYFPRYSLRTQTQMCTKLREQYQSLCPVEPVTLTIASHEFSWYIIL